MFRDTDPHLNGCCIWVVMVPAVSRFVGTSVTKRSIDDSGGPERSDGMASDIYSVQNGTPNHPTRALPMANAQWETFSTREICIVIVAIIVVIVIIPVIQWQVVPTVT